MFDRRKDLLESGRSVLAVICFRRRKLWETRVHAILSAQANPAFNGAGARDLRVSEAGGVLSNRLMDVFFDRNAM